jgi:hypothetical protein
MRGSSRVYVVPHVFVIGEGLSHHGPTDIVAWLQHRLWTLVVSAGTRYRKEYLMSFAHSIA